MPPMLLVTDVGKVGYEYKEPSSYISFLVALNKQILVVHYRRPRDCLVLSSLGSSALLQPNSLWSYVFVNPRG